MGYDGGLNGAQKLLLIIARHLDIGQVDTKVTTGQPSFDSHRIPLWLLHWICRIPSKQCQLETGCAGIPGRCAVKSVTNRVIVP
jgi:hypothetical protein